MNGKQQLKRESRVCQVALAVLSLLCLFPMIMVLSVSFTDEKYVQEFGYHLLPLKPSLDTYIFLVGNKGKMLLKAFGITLTVTALGTLYSVSVTALFAYAVSQKKEVFLFARPLSFFAWFTSIFG